MNQSSAGRGMITYRWVHDRPPLDGAGELAAVRGDDPADSVYTDRDRFTVMPVAYADALQFLFAAEALELEPMPC